MPFEECTNDQAYLKMGIMGLQGSGKTYTATEVAIGLHDMLQQRGIKGGDQPIFMADTEIGSAWIRRRIEESGKKFRVDKSRSFMDLVNDIETVAENCGVLIIDSITHYWGELKNAYAEKKNRKYGLRFDDWDALKGPKLWGRFTDLLVNSTAHIIMCGRMGWNYDFEEHDDKKVLVKTDVKMKAEAETGYEPSILVMMERHQELSSKGSVERVWRTAYVLKDRANQIDGKHFDNPTFESFLPHIQLLNLGGQHVGVNSSRSSDSMIEGDSSSFKYENEQREIVLDEVAECLKKKYPSQSADDKQYRADLLEEFFHTRSWKKVASLPLNDIKLGYNELHKKLEGSPAFPEMESGDVPF